MFKERPPLTAEDDKWKAKEKKINMEEHLKGLLNVIKMQLIPSYVVVIPASFARVVTYIK